MEHNGDEIIPFGWLKGLFNWRGSLLARMPGLLVQIIF